MQNIQWTSFAFIRYLIFFIAGILFAIYLPDTIANPFYLLLTSFFLLLLLSIFLKRVYFYRYNYVLGICATVFLFLAGYAHLSFHKYSSNPKHLMYSESDSELSYYVAKVVDRIEEKPKSWKSVVEISKYNVTGTWRYTTAKVSVYFDKSASKIPQYGDVLIVKGAPKLMDEPANPYEFNFKRFISFHNIYHQQYVRADDFMIVDNNPANYFIQYAYQLRTLLSSILEQKLEDPKSLQIAKALVLGIKDDLDNEIQRAYAAAGAMHVLAVSGLHVGIIYGFLLLLIGKWKDHDQLRWPFLLICICFLWSYAMVTGLSPSVKRAATMFSFIVLAQVLRRDSNIYNTLAASAFFLLCFDPYLVMSVGFQLSYLAVIGIVYLQPKLYHLIYFPNWLLDKVWAITCVSIAAQFATAPLGVLYFHQFPTYFFVSNLLVIPAAFVILCGGLATLLLSIFPWVGDWLGYLLDKIIYVVNYGVALIERLPQSTVEGIFISTPQSWLIYLFLFCIIAFFELRQLKWFAMAVLFVAVFQWNELQRVFQNSNLSELVVYKVDNHSVWEIIDAGKHFVFADEGVRGDQERLKFHIFPNQMQAGLLSVNQASLAFEQKIRLPILSRSIGFAELYIYNGQTIMFWHSRPPYQYSPIDSVKVDVLIIANNAVRNVEQLQKICEPAMIVFDSSNKIYQLKYFLTELENANLAFHNTRTQGAFIKPI